MKVWILTEGGRERGLGHVVRCRAIGDALEEVGVSPRFVVEGDDSTEAILGPSQMETRAWIREPARLADVVGREATILVDSLTITQQGCRAIEDTFARTAFIDDYQRHEYLHSLVIDWTIGIESDPHYAARNDRPNVEYLLGAKYAALRREFWDIPEKHIAAGIGNILLMFGGSDVRDLTPPVLRAVIQHYPNARKSVIVGHGYANEGAIGDARDGNTRLLRRPTTTEIVEAMLAADVAICGGGQTLYELARVGVPSIATCIVENQRFDIDGWRRAGAIHVAGNWNDPLLIARVLDALKSLESHTERATASRIGRSLIDGRGARAIRDRLLADRGRRAP